MMRRVSSRHGVTAIVCQMPALPTTGPKRS